MIHELTLAVIDSGTDFYFLYMKVISYTNCYIFSESRHQKRRLQTEQLPEEEVKRLKEESSLQLLQCRRILCVRVHIFVSGRHLGFGIWESVPSELKSFPYLLFKKQYKKFLLTTQNWP